MREASISHLAEIRLRGVVDLNRAVRIGGLPLTRASGAPRIVANPPPPHRSIADLKRFSDRGSVTGVGLVVRRGLGSLRGQATLLHHGVRG
jgi:hypothetical protein